jgi:hypothetical protein
MAQAVKAAEVERRKRMADEALSKRRQELETALGSELKYAPCLACHAFGFRKLGSSACCLNLVKEATRSPKALAFISYHHYAAAGCHHLDAFWD